MYTIEKSLIKADQNRLGLLVMLGLGKQVHGHPVGIRPAVAENHYLRRPGHHVQPHTAKHRFLGGDHVAVAGTDYFVDCRDSLRAKGQGRDGLSAANSENTTDASHFCGYQHQRVQITSGAGTVMIISATPATAAGIAFINTDDG